MIRRLLSGIVFLSGTAFSQNKARVSVFLDSTLTTQYNYFTVRLLEMPVDGKIILDKLGMAALRNQKWFEGYVLANNKKTIATGLPYHKNLGVSKQEYGKLRKMYLLMDKFSDRDKYYVNILRRNDSIIMKSKTKNPVFNSLKIDLKTLKVNLDGWELTVLPAEIDSTNDFPVGRLRGYSWRYEAADSKTSSNQNRKYPTDMIYLQVGQSVSTGKVLLRVWKQKIANRKPQLNDDWFCQLN